jgi:hypothetical protein
MVNNSYLLVLARGYAIISLNGQQVLVRNTLHVPGLAVPQNGAHLLIVLPTIFSMPSTWILLLVTASLWGATGMLSFWLIALPAIIGLSA